MALTAATIPLMRTKRASLACGLTVVFLRGGITNIYLTRRHSDVKQQTVSSLVAR